MPVRVDPDLELITREYGQGKTLTRTKVEWEESDARILELDTWNKEVDEFLKDLKDELFDKFEYDFKLKARAFRNLSEDAGSEKFTPRQYLGYEVLTYTDTSKEEKYLFSNYKSFKDLKETLIQDIYVKRTSKEQPTGTDGGCGGETPIVDGGEHREE